MLRISPCACRVVSAVFLVALFLLSPLASSSMAAEAVSKKAPPLRVKNVEIRGTKVRLPIPDGYEEMQREDQPETYDWLVKTASGDDRIPLAYFINSEDKAALRRGDAAVDLRYGTAHSEDIYWDDIIGDDFLEYSITTMKKYADAISKRVDKNIRKKNRIPMTRSMLHQGKKSVSFFSVSQEKQPGEFFPGALVCRSYIVVDKKIVEITVWRDAFGKPGIEDFRQDMLRYLLRIDDGNP